jgi:hypothetical protein
MKNNEDLKEDLLDNIEPVLTSFHGNERRTVTKEIARIAAFFGTKDQVPVVSVPEAAGILQEVIWELCAECEVQGDLKTFSLS